MSQKKTNSRATTASKENNIILETIRKPQLSASNEFEVKKLSRSQDGFLPCSIEEERESLVIRFDVHNVLLWLNIRREKRELMISALIDAGKLQKTAELYHFTLNPDNLYYDIQGRVSVKFRDVYSQDSEYSKEEFLTEYKSLIGCTLVKKYKFEDYEKGGQDLLKEDDFLNSILECTDVEQILEKLHEEYFRYREDHHQRFVEIPRTRNRAQKTVIGIFGVLVVAGAMLAGYLLLWVRPYEEAVIAANEAYLQSDYNGTVEALDPVEVERMNVYQKYILAVSCVRCENFSEDSLRNILNTITLNGDERVMECSTNSGISIG